MQTVLQRPEPELINFPRKDGVHSYLPFAPRALIRGRILVNETGALVILTDQGPMTCRIAASCLLRPEAGDLALLSLPEDAAGEVFALAVLERARPDAVMAIDLGCGARLAAEQGAVEVVAGTDLRLRAGAQLEASAQSVSFVTGAARWLTQTFTLLGNAVETVCTSLRESSRDRETTAESWTQRLGDCHRHVESLDETQAGVSRTLARETALLHGRVTYVQAEEFVKVDGQEVHLG